MFVNVGKTLASQTVKTAVAIGQAVKIAGLMKVHGIKAFSSKFQQLQLEAAARGHKQEYRRNYLAKGKGEQQRRWLQNAHQHQLDSHKPGTLQPKHIFGAVHGN